MDRKRRYATLAAAGICSLSLGLTACGSGAMAAQQSTGATPVAMAEGEFGPGCTAVPKDPANPGSFEAMAQQPVATAASGNPVLSTLVTAVKQAGLVDTLNKAEGLTVFAPTNDKILKAAGGEILWTDPKIKVSLWKEPSLPAPMKVS